MSRRIIPVLCALAVAIVPATALAQPAQDPSPVVTRGGVVYGDTKYDLQNQQDLSAPIGDTKSDLTPVTPAVQLTPATPKSFASHDDGNGWQIAAWAEAAVLAALAVGSVVLISGRTRSRRLSS